MIFMNIILVYNVSLFKVFHLQYIFSKFNVKSQLLKFSFLNFCVQSINNSFINMVNTVKLLIESMTQFLTNFIIIVALGLYLINCNIFYTPTLITEV